MFMLAWNWPGNTVGLILLPTVAGATALFSIVRSHDTMSATSAPPKRRVESSAASGMLAVSVGEVSTGDDPLLSTSVWPVPTQLASNMMMPFGDIENLPVFQK